jgi:predicted enzyme related to lactoylglutathione lyase
MHELRHFSIGCDDVERAKRFYENVFGWHIAAWGPPGYYLILPSYPDRTVTGDLYERDEPASGTGRGGFECTFGVDDLRKIEAAVVANGGKIARPEIRIEGVGNVFYFVDTEGNRAAAMKYDGC